MRLTPSERDRLLIFSAAQLARARRARGLLLNVPEATALVADAVCEAARDGLRVADAVAAGCAVLGAADLLPGVSDAVSEVCVEAVFDDGSRLVVVPDPFGAEPVLPASAAASVSSSAPGRPDGVTVTMVNTSAVTVRVSSHVHVFEINPRVAFDRAAGWGRHADLPAGSVVALPPGEPTSVRLVPFGGERVIVGFSGFADGPLDAPGAKEAALASLRSCGYADTGVAAESGAEPGAESAAAVGAEVAVGQRIRLLRERPPGTDAR